MELSRGVYGVSDREYGLIDDGCLEGVGPGFPFGRVEVESLRFIAWWRLSLFWIEVY